ncbi:MAG: hypothetical protein ACRC2T_13385 [Thermoguttaceae bacterium]
MTQQAERIDPRLVRTDCHTQSRLETDRTTVEDYVAAMQSGEKFPPISICRDENGDLILVDGFHRLFAHLEVCPDQLIEAVIQSGTVSDARWLSFAANRNHGLRRSRADTQRIIAEALRHEQGVKMSDRQIAEHVGVDKNTVAAARRKLAASGEIHQSECREGADGRKYKVKSIEPAKNAHAPQDEADVVYVSLPRVPQHDPKALAKVLNKFFDEAYLKSLVSEIHNTI